MTQKTDDKINVFWFLPTHGDGRYLGTAEGGRPLTCLTCSRWRWRPTVSATTGC